MQEPPRHARLQTYTLNRPRLYTRSCGALQPPRPEAAPRWLHGDSRPRRSRLGAGDRPERIPAPVTGAMRPPAPPGAPPAAPPGHCSAVAPVPTPGDAAPYPAHLREAASAPAVRRRSPRAGSALTRRRGPGSAPPLGWQRRWAGRGGVGVGVGVSGRTGGRGVCGELSPARPGLASPSPAQPTAGLPPSGTVADRRP